MQPIANKKRLDEPSSSLFGCRPLSVLRTSPPRGRGHPDGNDESHLPLGGGWERGCSLVLVNSTTASCASAINHEGCIAVRHLEGTRVGAVAFGQGD